ncbi:MAG: hypothetical protein ABIP71_11855, partial [Verrucomicrobiota bacterium]
SRFYRIVLLPSAQNLIISTNAISVLEGGTNNFSVRLSIQPASSITVTVARLSGSTNIEPAAGTTLIYTSGNWNIPQSVPIRALPDTDTVNGQALFTIASTGLGTRSVAVTEIDGGSVPLRITNISRSGQNILISFTTTSGQQYRLERTTSLALNVWTTSVDNISGTGNVVQVSDVGGAGGTVAFYRIRLLP